MRFKLILLSLTVAAGLSSVSAQTKPVFGARVAMEVTFPGGAGSDFNTGAGLTAGGVMKVFLPKNFYFEPGLLFTYSGMNAKNYIKFDDSYYQGGVRQYGLRLPLNVGYTIDPGRIWTLDVYTGPWINFNLSASQTLDPNFAAPEPVPDKTVNLMKHGWKRVDAMWGFGLSFTFAKSYHIGLSGGIGLSPLAQYGNRDKKVRIHRSVASITLGYNF